jgi:uncharacterized membrane protein
MIVIIIAFVVAGCAVFAYVPLVLLVRHRDKVTIARRRPIDVILRDAYAQGRLSREDWEAAIDEVHKAMPTLDAPYPRVRELEERKL